MPLSQSTTNPPLSLSLNSLRPSLALSDALSRLLSRLQSTPTHRCPPRRVASRCSLVAIPRATTLCTRPATTSSCATSTTRCWSTSTSSTPAPRPWPRTRRAATTLPRATARASCESGTPSTPSTFSRSRCRPSLVRFAISLGPAIRLASLLSEMAASRTSSSISPLHERI